MFEICTINLPDWIQAICAFATLLLAIIIAFQQKKINTLTDVVKSLDEQARISQDLLFFEMRSRINDVQPNFITLNNKYDINHYIFSLKNVGQRARNVRFEKVENLKTLNLDNPGNKVISTESSVQGNYTIINKDSGFSFKVHFEDNNGDYFFQFVKGDSRKRLTITLPERQKISEQE